MIGIGVDAVDIERFRRSLDRTPTMRERLFTSAELAYVAPQADPVPSLAVRFAAREAVMKALGLGLGAFGFHEVSVARHESGAPFLLVEGIVQTEDGVTAIRAEKVWPLEGLSADAAVASHDFH